MQPKKKPPSQAGKFKPLKRPAAAGAKSASSSTTAGNPESNAGQRGRSSLDGRATGAHHTAGRGGGGDHRSRSPTGRGRGGRGGRGGGGRDGRGRGRGRGGRAGRFIIPTGAAFFTGESIKRNEAGAGAGTIGIGGASHEYLIDNVKVEAGTDGAVFMPGSNSARSATTASSNNGKVARSAAESMAAAARAKAGEGEEIIVAEMMDLEGDDDDGAGKKKSVLDGPSRSGMPSLFDDENQNDELVDHHSNSISDAFLYDSDSSAEEQRARRRKEHGGGGGFQMPPSQLPFPTASHQQSMYDCQDEELMTKGEEKKMSDADAHAAAATTTKSSKLSDPPLQSPFLDLESVSDSLKQLETSSWFVMKFPTRLPHLDTSSSSANAAKRAAALIKSEMSEDAVPEIIGSSPVVDLSSAPEKVGSVAPSAAGATPSMSGPALGYDDTLKDAASGRYGRIVVRKSGKTELIIGGGEGNGPEVRLLVHEGLQCGFRQEAVCIDPDEATFVALGDVDKSLIVTPDIDRAFVFS